jgi:Uncharacterized protein conserved in bacteria
MKQKKETIFKVLRVIATVMANLTAVLSANYIVFYILDHFNTGFHFVVHSDFFLTKYLHLVIPFLMLLTALLYLLLYVAGGLKRRCFRAKRLIVILVADVLVAGAFAMVVNARAFGWVKWLRPTEAAPVALATLPPKETPVPTEAVSPAPTDEIAVQTSAAPTGTDAAPSPEETPEPTEAPTPAPTPIPGLLGDRYREKFSDGDPIVTEPNTSETLEDGTVRTLIYAYAGKNAAFELYHYQKGKLEYQIADVYVREIEKLTAAYVNSQNDRKGIAAFAEGCGALVAISSDYFANNANSQGLIIRNGLLIRNRECRDSDLCVVYQDGTVRCFDCRRDRIDNNEILASYPYHSFYFGPSLLDENGGAKTEFNSSLGGSNPRTAFGYYEPGHYAFISVLGGYDIYDYSGHKAGKGKQRA